MSTPEKTGILLYIPVDPSNPDSLQRVIEELCRLLVENRWGRGLDNISLGVSGGGRDAWRVAPGLATARTITFQSAPQTVAAPTNGKPAVSEVKPVKERRHVPVDAEGNEIEQQPEPAGYHVQTGKRPADWKWDADDAEARCGDVELLYGGKMIRWCGKNYYFNETHAPAVRILFRAFVDGIHDVHSDILLNAANDAGGTSYDRVADLFEKVPAYKDDVICRGPTVNFYRIKVPGSAVKGGKSTPAA